MSSTTTTGLCLSVDLVVEAGVVMGVVVEGETVVVGLVVVVVVVVVVLLMVVVEVDLAL